MYDGERLRVRVGGFLFFGRKGDVLVFSALGWDSVYVVQVYHSSYRTGVCGFRKADCISGAVILVVKKREQAKLPKKPHRQY